MVMKIHEEYKKAPVLKYSLIFWCIYMIASGLLLAFTPDLLLNFFGVAEPTDSWIRSFGALAFIIGVSYIVILKEKVPIGFIKWSIFARYFFFLFSVISYLMEWTEFISVLIGSFDFLNATWTLVGIKIFFKRYKV